MLLSEGQMSDHKGAFLLMASLPGAKELLGDKGYDSYCFREALAERGDWLLEEAHTARPEKP